MADAQNQPTINLPQRTITITGAMTARLYQLSIRASRIDLRSMQVAMARPAVRDPSNRAIDSFMQAVARFEAEMASVEKELDNASRNNPNDRSIGQSGKAQGRTGRDSRNQTTGGNKGLPAASPAIQAIAQGAAAGGETAKPRARNRNKNKGNGGANAQTANEAKQSVPQKPLSAANPAPAPAQSQRATAPAAATTEHSVPVKQHAVAPVSPMAEVPANIQAL